MTDEKKNPIFPQLAPSYDITKKTKKLFTEINRDSSETVTTQLWQRSGSCPEGTIPIRRIEKNNGSKGDVVEKYGTKKLASFHDNKKKQLNESKMLNLLQPNHSVAILLTLGFAYLGAKGDIKVWTPQVESDDEYSTSRVALRSGPRLDYDAIESGWAVNPSVYGDRQTRLYVYWTADGSKKTGCFDLTCPGFIQTSNQIALGAAIYPISNPTGLPYQITVYIYKDPNTSNWWVQYGERINIGYWPSDLFGMLRAHAETVQWGGDVYSSKVGTHPHTATGMGSGRFSDYIMQSSGYIKRMRVLRNNMELTFPQWINIYTDEYNCYDAYYLSDYVEEPEFYYGGPGRNYKCP
ncbi:unnamed protein product [Fraxinus pennsylvanica]|uniref:Neprosin PEP catalytic domain-containing protein n=1 Tax=Fraxinus pennsylvanica TaxID=56036 RepID=A0AAD2DL03_9LAMI|nr:unnamed protein product [Fraxinus pennsylvanica]